jgi:hypothetical protein
MKTRETYFASLAVIATDNFASRDAVGISASI